jgi:hypothetical protein
MTQTIRVRAANDDGRVALWERAPEHPGGEVYVANDAVVEVALTTEVARRIAQGVLVEVGSSAVEPPEPPQDPADGGSDEGASEQRDDPGTTPAPLDEALVAKLAEGGYDTADAIQAATDEQLLAIDGIGPATLKRIREAYPTEPAGNGGEGEGAGASDQQGGE